jgi:hypothetical protein
MESWMPAFVIVVAIAVVLQAIVLIALFLQLRRTAARMEQVVNDLNTRVTPVLIRLQTLVEDVSPQISGIVSNAAEVTRLVRSQTQKIDRLVTETMERLRLQLMHVDQILTGAMEAVEEAGSHLRQTVWRPVIKATALVRGVQAGLEYLRSARRTTVGSETENQDEGMFI